MTEELHEAADGFHPDSNVNDKPSLNKSKTHCALPVPLIQGTRLLGVRSTSSTGDNPSTTHRHGPETTRWQQKPLHNRPSRPTKESQSQPRRSPSPSLQKSIRKKLLCQTHQSCQTHQPLRHSKPQTLQPKAQSAAHPEHDHVAQGCRHQWGGSQKPQKETRIRPTPQKPQSPKHVAHPSQVAGCAGCPQRGQREETSERQQKDLARNVSEHGARGGSGDCTRAASQGYQDTARVNQRHQDQSKPQMKKPQLASPSANPSKRSFSVQEARPGRFAPLPSVPRPFAPPLYAQGALPVQTTVADTATVGNASPKKPAQSSQTPSTLLYPSCTRRNSLGGISHRQATEGPSALCSTPSRPCTTRTSSATIEEPITTSSHLPISPTTERASTTPAITGHPTLSCSRLPSPACLNTRKAGGAIPKQCPCHPSLRGEDLAPMITSPVTITDATICTDLEGDRPIHGRCDQLAPKKIGSPAGTESNTASDVEYIMPLTTPGTPLVKERLAALHCARRSFELLQLDGGGSGGEEDAPDDFHQPIGDSVGNSAGQLPSANSQSMSPSLSEEKGSLSDNSSDDDVKKNVMATTSQDGDTPLVAGSPARSSSTFPFTKQAESFSLVQNSSESRHPSAYLRFLPPFASAREVRQARNGISSPDRFIPSRVCTPDKNGLMLQRTTPTKTGPRPLFGTHHLESDPFGTTPRRSLRMAEQYATIRTPLPQARSAPNRTSTLVPDARPAPPRAASTGAIWNVGGAIVTEGVASVTNGRGGRVTSGSNAAHYSADFLRRSTPSEEEVMHGRRLAIAMDINQNARMLHHTPVSSRASPMSRSPGSSSQRRVFRDGAWETEEAQTPTRQRPRKTKDIPVIPFRVLDAPALRDDYYCSLLAYSATLECLAVGLGPHVYLWAENRSKTNIPDSLTSPYGSGHVTSVSFSSTDGGSAILAIGRADGRITLWSPLDRDPRFDSEQPAPVSCVAFRPVPVRRPSLRDPNASVLTEELLVGDELGFVYYYSVEWPSQDQRELFDWHGSMTLLARISCHTQQVCGIAWSDNGDYFATGGNDNCLYLYDNRNLLKRAVSTQRLQTDPSTTSPSIGIRNSGSNTNNNSSDNADASAQAQSEILTITRSHAKKSFNLNAAVKAIAFAPWQPSLLAAGGGSNDRCIHFFHAESGSRLATIDCYAQVTALVWSTKRKEIAATFGFAQPEHPYRIAVFAWPRGELLVAIPWFGEERALFAVPYPRGPATGRGGGGAHGRRGGAGAAVAPSSPSHRPSDAEGRAWYGRRTLEEGCLVVATSDASIKFHEIWAERPGGGRKRFDNAGGAIGLRRTLGGSQILEGECSEEIERRETIR